jgi:predicted P-loop ATPase
MEYKKPQDISPAVYAVARDNKRNPVADQLRALADVWQQSGKPDVLGDWLEKYMAAETAGIDDYVSKIGRICLMQAVRLVFREEVEDRWGLGTVKAQSMPVFISNGGQSKGKALEVLAGAVGPNLYTANKFNIGDAKDVVETLSRFLIVEWAEYGGSKDTAAFKQGMTNPFFTVRRPWGTESEDFERRFSLFATSNESEIITDPSRGEARRLWPIYTVWGRSGDEVGLRKVAPMLWGQAAWIALNTDERHWIDDQNPDRLETEVIRQWDAVIERCRVSGPTEEKLDEFLRKWAASSNWMSQMISSNDVARAAGAVDQYTNTPTAAEFRAVSRLMVARGMRRIQMPGTRAKGWTMPGAARENLKPNTSD